VARMSSLQRPVVVVGMHRSGTSLTASILGSSGLHLGERLMPAGHGNAEGHFEDLEFVQLHRAALQALGHHPEGWDEVVLDDMPDVLEAKARALVDARSSRPLWGWKDPRTTLFLPYLLPITAVGLVFSYIFQLSGVLNDFLHAVGLGVLAQDEGAELRIEGHLMACEFCRENSICLWERARDRADPPAFVQRYSCLQTRNALFRHLEGGRPLEEAAAVHLKECASCAEHFVEPAKAARLTSTISGAAKDAPGAPPKGNPEAGKS